MSVSALGLHDVSVVSKLLTVLVSFTFAAKHCVVTLVGLWRIVGVQDRNRG